MTYDEKFKKLMSNINSKKYPKTYTYISPT